MHNGLGIFNIFFIIIPIIVIAGFIIVFGIIISNAIKYYKDKKKPIIPVDAKVLSKRMNVTRYNNISDTIENNQSYTNYYVTFELKNGERLELRIPNHQIGYMVEGDSGILSFQGELFVSFERKKHNSI